MGQGLRTAVTTARQSAPWLGAREPVLVPPLLFLNEPPHLRAGTPLGWL